MVMFRKDWRLPSSRGTSLSDNTELSDESDSDHDPDASKGPTGLNLLFSGSDPLVDLVFVHGLGGGSRRTWTILDKPANFWPKEWLSNDADFSRTRVHSFGYEAEWRRKGSVLDIHDFARSLLSSVQNSPEIRKSKTKIVFIGHSMGGIVIKKAYMFVQQDPELRSFAARIHSVYFLATPHRGSNLAGTLNKILSITYGQKTFVQEIERNSTSVEAINDAFRHFGGNIHLYSFYETKPLAKSGFHAMIVDKDSAVLGYPNEQSIPLSTDHRGVCKFSSTDDVNYKALRNALSATVDAIIAEGMNRSVSSLGKGRLMSLMAISDEPDNDLATLDNNRAAGSCRWFAISKAFMSWSQESQAMTSILWLSGNAASGKSTICSYAIRAIQERNRCCYYFFFKQGCAGKSTTAECIRFIAYQMACHSESARSKIISLESQGLLPNREDDRTLWRRLFQDCIFEGISSNTHYWIIDALDECQNPQNLLRLLSSLPSNIQVMISSRVTNDIEHGFANLKRPVSRQQLTPSDTETDIRLFIISSIGRLPAVPHDGRLELTTRIVAKSSGSFLWVRLVMQELENAYSKESIESILNEIPTGMTELYDRMLQRVAVNRGTKLAQSILMWVTCASRALSLDELRMAIRLDVNETLSNPERSIPSICDQFLVLDHSLRPLLIHETAQEYLLRQELVPELMIRKRGSNTRLANVCLNFLSSDWFGRQRQEQRRPSYAQRLKSMDRSKGPKPDISSLEAAFATYACFHFSDHISRASADLGLLDLLCSFLNENTLPWIEYIARKGELSILVRTATNLKRFLQRHVRHLPPIDWRVSSIEAWSTDLIRVAAKFRAQLLASPGCIHSLVPALCPSESIISRVRTLPNQSFIVAGLKSKDWDDCITRIDFNNAKPSAIACGDSLFAIGLSDGRIYSYYELSLQHHHTIDHGERAKFLRYGNGDRHLLIAGSRTVRLWDLDSCCFLWSYHCSRQPLAIAFMADDEFVNIALQSSTIITLRTLDGVEVGKLNLFQNPNRGFTEFKSLAPPSLMEFSADSNFLAIACRGQPVRLFDVNEEKLCLECHRDTMSVFAVHYSVDAMAFNPNPEIPVLVISFGDGELDVFNIWSGNLVCKIPGTFAHNLACAPDGKCLVTASAQGCIQIYDFGGISGEHLSLSYQINANDPGIRALAFASSSLRFLDIRTSQCRVWEPDFLVRRDGDGSSQSDLAHSLPARIKHRGVLKHSSDPEISAIYCHTGGQTIFCGTRDGSIYSYDAVDAKYTGTIYNSSSNIAVVAVKVLSTDITVLVSADEAGYLSFWHISEDGNSRWTPEKSSGTRMDETIARILVSTSGVQVFVTGTQTLSLWSASGEQLFRQPFFTPQYVLPHPSAPDLLIDLARGSARVLSWTDLANECVLEEQLLAPSSSLNTSVSTFSFVSNHSFAVALRKDSTNPTSAWLKCWPASALEPGAESVSTLLNSDQFGPQIEQLVAFAGLSTLLFLDTELWLCSVEITVGSDAAVRMQEVKRHFFVPSEWRGALGTMLLAFSEARREVVVVVGSGVVVVKRGLEVAVK